MASLLKQNASVDKEFGEDKKKKEKEEEQQMLEEMD